MKPQSVYFCNVFLWMPNTIAVCITLYRPFGDTFGSSVVIMFLYSLRTDKGFASF